MTSRPSKIVSAIDPLGLYAAAIDTSNYVAEVSPRIRLAPEDRSVLDVGAGGGQLGRAITPAGGSWSTIEPSPLMRARLERLSPRPVIIPCRWEDAEVNSACHDVVLAATMPALFDDPARFLSRCKSWARRRVVWVAPAQEGPKGLILAGCLPSEWHAENETPGVDIVLRKLPRDRQPEHVDIVEWTFSAIVPAIEPIAAYLADRLNWPARDGRRPELVAHLQRQAIPDPAGCRLDIPRKSAILEWSL